LHADLFGDDRAALTMMAGSPTESIKAAFGLADLAERARVLELAGLFLTTPVGDLLPELRTSDAGRAFLIELNGWLETYGLRQDLFDFATVTWREDPAYALASVRNYLETGHDPRADHDTTGRAARLAYETAQVRLATYPAAIREQFEQRLQAAREGAFLQEEHNFYIDQQGMALLRLFYLEIGEHLRDVGMLDEAADVFMLRIDEIRRLNDDIAPARHRADIRPLVASRRDELAQAALLTPPPVIGDPSTFPKPPDGPMMRAVTAFFGGPPQVSEVSGQLRGNPGSRGVASGSARVARTLAEAQALRAGEILVAVTTMPPWTPLFGIAAAVVTETGGALSHCAIVAREYGVPAVVGVAGATTAIRTGQRLTVDGGSGLVTIEP
jgi:pyruvate,water dikinase